VSEGVMLMISNGVPKYSAQWWERVNIGPAEESAKTENLPPSTASLHLSHDRDARTVKRKRPPHVAAENPIYG
jgi:hypothetical protein